MFAACNSNQNQPVQKAEEAKKAASKAAEAKTAGPEMEDTKTAEPVAAAVKPAEAKPAEAPAPEPKAPEYKNVVIGGKPWMAANLAVSADKDGKPVTCYADTKKDADFVKKYGCLYQWAEARNVCPAGWHLPSKAEFEDLLKAVGTNNNKVKPNPAFAALIAKDALWTGEHSDKATNSSAFGALPAGQWIGGNYDIFGTYAYFWSDTVYEEEEADSAYLLSLGEGYASVMNDDQSYAYSVRCVKNAP